MQILVTLSFLRISVLTLCMTNVYINVLYESYKGRKLSIQFNSTHRLTRYLNHEILFSTFHFSIARVALLQGSGPINNILAPFFLQARPPFHCRRDLYGSANKLLSHIYIRLSTHLGRKDIFFTRTRIARDFSIPLFKRA